MMNTPTHVWRSYRIAYATTIAGFVAACLLFNVAKPIYMAVGHSEVKLAISLSVILLSACAFVTYAVATCHARPNDAETMKEVNGVYQIARILGSLGIMMLVVLIVAMRYMQPAG